MFIDLTPDDPRWATALPVLQQLRPHLTAELLVQVAREGRDQGLRFTALYEDERCLAVAGWRVMANTSGIRKLYVDDLCADERARSRGHGHALLDELARRAAELDCFQLELDSGVTRHDAHRFYLRERMDIVAYHFRRTIR